MNESRPVDADQVPAEVRELIDGELRGPDGEGTSTLVVAGPPRSGKTTVATRALLVGMETFGDRDAFMVVSGRTAADRISRQVILERGSAGRTRPVGTLQALAFQVLTQAASLTGKEGASLPRLLNGAEQDALLRQVMADHIEHVRAGDDCAVCRLLERYFQSESGWSSVLVTQADGQVEGVSNRFIAQLRDMFARMTELGVTSGDRDQLLSALETQSIDLDRKERLGLQWRLAFALNDEYLECIDRTYPGEFRLDPSLLMVGAAEGVGRVDGLTLPRFLVVDDWQDVTLAGMGFLQTLNRAGCRLLLVGNCDQSVQSFRGSYPEFLATRLTGLSARIQGDAAPMLADDFACLDARQMVLEPRRIVVPYMDGRGVGQAGASGPDRTSAASGQGPGDDSASALPDRESHDGPGSYADLVAARISLGIASLEEADRPLPGRPGKLPAWPGAGPVAPLASADPLLADGSVRARLFHTPAQEEDDLVWQVKHEFLTQGRDWNEMAVIAHDNATIRALGRKLRVQGVPVRYSSVTRPLSEDPTIQGLFALVELAQAVQDPSTLPTDETSPAAVASWVRRHLRTLMVSPLISAKVGEGRHERPVRMEHLESLMDSMAVLSRVRSSGDSDPTCGETSSRDTDTTAAAADPAEETLSALPGLVAAWQDWARAIRTQETDTARQRGIKVDDSLISGTGQAPTSASGLSVDALQTMLLLDPQDSSQTILAVMAAIAGGRMEDPDVHALRHALKVVTTTADRIAALPDSQPQYVLWEAWRSLGLADDWQRRALVATQEGEEVNDRLDALMRLFQYAAGSQRFRTVQAFMDQVRSMQIEADSLAHIGPIEHAVTLTTPAGAAALARVWPLVWLPAIQDGVWPNLTPRDTMFGAEDLADLVLHNRIGEPDRSSFSHDPRLQSILYAEKKGFLEAVTRAGEQVRVSAVWNDDTVPSDFLYGYLPEFYERTSDMAQADFTQVGAGAEESREYGGLEVSPRGLTAAARSLLARQALREDGADQARIDDAVDTLRLLSKSGLQEADPRCWPFLYADFEAEEHADQSGSDQTRAMRSGSDQSGSGQYGSDQFETGQSPSVDSVEEGSNLADSGPGGHDRAPSDASESVLSVSKIREVGTSVPTMGKSPAQEPDASDQALPQVVSLSPSAVDRIWQCPLEWVMSDRYSGPQPSRVATDFGSLIHRVAQEGTNRGLDKPDQGELGQDARSLTDRKARVSAELLDIYQEFAQNPPDGLDPKGLYDIHSREHQVEGIIDTLASYFVHGSTDGYGCGGNKPVPVGSLEGVQSERSFNVTITMDDLSGVWRATFPDRPLSRERFFSLLSGLVGGFPEALTPATAVRLTGRIDRLESRCIEGRHYLRLVDYKTGRVHSGTQLFNDLQLVCYQLGLAFQTSEEGVQAGAEAGWSLPGAPDPGKGGGLPISQSILFDVAKPPKDPDRGTRPEEARYQPPIFHNGAFTSNYQARTGVPNPSKLADLEDLPVESPQGVDQEVWDMVRNHAGGDQIAWDLTMVARIFFAAGVRLSANHPDALFDPSRCHKHGRDGVCAAWEQLAPNLLEDQE